jgi:hypothetical protein
LARVASKSITVAVPPQRLFAFLMDGRNWPQWAIHNVKGVKVLDDGTFELQTPRGPGHLKLTGDAATGVIDQVFTAPDSGTWRVPGRVVPIAGGSAFLMAFPKPAALSDDAFTAGMKQLDDELATLKKVLESR